MNRLFPRRYPRLADYFSAPLVRESDPNARAGSPTINGIRGRPGVFSKMGATS